MLIVAGGIIIYLADAQRAVGCYPLQAQQLDRFPARANGAESQHLS
jgi:hypothetical protein